MRKTGDVAVGRIIDPPFIPAAMADYAFGSNPPYEL
jgi:hypothetical protein